VATTGTKQARDDDETPDKRDRNPEGRTYRCQAARGLPWTTRVTAIARTLIYVNHEAHQPELTEQQAEGLAERILADEYDERS
jgi:hypothetical protein